MRTLACGISVGSFLVLVGALAIGIVPWMIHNGIRDLLKIQTPSSAMYDSFKNSSAKGVEVYKTFHLYHIKNPHAAQHGGPNGTTVKPDVELVGPFTVREFETYNESVTRWLPNATMRYRSFTVYEPVSGDWDRNVTIPKLSMFAFHKALHYADRLIHDNKTEEALLDLFLDLDAAIKNVDTSSLFVTKTVREIFYGYDDSLADLLATTFGRKPSPMALNGDTSYTDYATGETEDECYTGGEASSTQPAVPENSYRVMTMWHSIRVATYWATEEANTIGGTDATAFHPFLKKGEALLVWVNSLLRKVMLTYQKEVEHSGITTYRHIIDPAALDASNPENQAYFMLKQGWISAPPNVTSMPVNFTKAMLLDADASLVDVDGLPELPPRDEIDTYLDIEPLTGTLMSVHKRIQINVDLNQFKWELPDWFNETNPESMQKMKAFAHVHPTYLPVMFLDQHMDLPEKIINDLKAAVFTPLLLSKVLGGLAVAIGGVLVIASIVIRILAVRREERNYQSHEFYLVNDKTTGDV